MPRKAITVSNAVTVGPYAHAIECGDLLYLSGQTPLDPQNGEMVKGDITAQTAQCFKNLFTVLTAAGLTPDDVVKVNVYLTDMGNFAALNAVYVTQFKPPYPARTTVGVASLPLGALVEIEMIARKPASTP